MSFRCQQCKELGNKVQVHRQGRLVVTHIHEVRQYDRYHKREVVTNEIKREERMCLPCAAAFEVTPLPEPLGLIREECRPEVNSWLVEAIEQAQTDEVE